MRPRSGAKNFRFLPLSSAGPAIGKTTKYFKQQTMANDLVNICSICSHTRLVTSIWAMQKRLRWVMLLLGIGCFVATMSFTRSAGTLLAYLLKTPPLPVMHTQLNGPMPILILNGHLLSA